MDQNALIMFYSCRSQQHHDFNSQTTNNFESSSTNHDNDQRLVTSTDNSKFTWLWWWLPLRWSKHLSLSPQTVFSGLHSPGQSYFTNLVIFGTYITVKSDVLFQTTLQTSAATLIFWLTTCSEQFATAGNNLFTSVANLFVQIPLQIAIEITKLSL